MSLSINRILLVSTNSTGDYEFLRNTRAYLSSKLMPEPRFKDDWKKPELHDFTKTFGFSSPRKFLQQKEQWDSLSSPVPRLYYEMQGVDFNTLDLTVELDRDEFEQNLKRPRYPAEAWIRSGAFAVPVRFQEPLKEECAVLKFIRSSCKYSRGQPLHIDYRGFLSIEVYGPDCPVKYFYKEPCLQVTGDEVRFYRNRVERLSGLS